MATIETQELSGTLDNTNSLRGTLNGDNNLSGALSNARSGGSGSRNEALVVDLKSLEQSYFDEAVLITQASYPTIWQNLKDVFEELAVDMVNNKASNKKVILIESSYGNNEAHEMEYMQAYGGRSLIYKEIDVDEKVYMSKTEISNMETQTGELGDSFYIEHTSRESG